MPTKRLLRIGDVEERTGLGRAMIYRLIQRGEFNKPVPITKQARGWPEDEVDAFVAKRIAARDAGAGQ